MGEMTARKQEADDSMEPACMLCGRAEADPDICGYKLQKRGLCAHLFCLVSAPGAPSSLPTGSPGHALLLITSLSCLSCAVFCQQPLPERVPQRGPDGIPPEGYSPYSQAGITAGKDWTSSGRSVVPRERCGSLAQTPRKKSQPFQAALGQKSRAQQLHRASTQTQHRSLVRRAHPRALTRQWGSILRLPGGVGLALEALRLPLMGAALLFPALLRL
ncbi:uncharacterized protein LOC122154040, partial [Tyto alba]|uniref:uncharacterized protein LOC122154040 n=1 Tax=Tyto alba TaxID=56313 RepID=UPI001C6865FA